MKIKNFFMDFANSFKPKLIWLYIIIFDLFFYGVSVFAVKLFGSFLTNKSNTFNLPAATDLTTLPAAELEMLANQLQNLFISLVVSSIILVIVILTAWTLTRGFIYSLLLKKKFTKKVFGKFILLNLFLSAVITVILVFFISIGLLVKDAIQSYYFVFYAVLLVISYYLALNYIFFTKKNVIFESIGKTLTTGTKNIPKLFFPCLLILIVSFIVQRIHLLISVQAAPILSLIIFTLFMAWARSYFVKEAEKIKN